MTEWSPDELAEVVEEAKRLDRQASGDIRISIDDKYVDFTLRLNWYDDD